MINDRKFDKAPNEEKLYKPELPENTEDTKNKKLVKKFQKNKE